MLCVVNRGQKFDFEIIAKKKKVIGLSAEIESKSLFSHVIPSVELKLLKGRKNFDF